MRCTATWGTNWDRRRPWQRFTVSHKRPSKSFVELKYIEPKSTWSAIARDMVVPDIGPENSRDYANTGALILSPHFRKMRTARPFDLTDRRNHQHASQTEPLQLAARHSIQAQSTSPMAAPTCHATGTDTDPSLLGCERRRQSARCGSLKAY